MNAESKNGITVEEAATRLQQLAQRSRAPMQLVIPYETGRVMIGGTPSKPVFDFKPGFDWDKGKVFVDIGERLSAPSTEWENDRELLRRAVDTIGIIALQVRKERVSSDDKLRAIAKTLANFSTRVSSPDAAVIATDAQVG